MLVLDAGFYGLALILIFVSLKMLWLNSMFDGKFPISWSLGIIGALLAGSIVASLLGFIAPAGTPCHHRVRSTS